MRKTMTEAELYSVYKGVYVPKGLHPPECLKYYEEFNFRQDDILIATYPKSGTTWMQEIVPLIQSEGDLTPVQTIPNWDRVPWLEEHRASILNLEERPSPRIFATHFHYNMMPESFFKVKPKVLYVLRNPKDIFTSSFHYYGMASFLVNPGTVDEFMEKFLNGKVMFGSWFDHVKGWIHAKDQEHILYIFYEEMIMDLKESVRKLSCFMGKSLSEEVIEKISDHCVFKNMKQNKMSNYSLVPTEFFDQKKSEFLRKGIVGDWRNTLTTAQSDNFDTVYKEKMKDVKFKFFWD
ncbi:sulfotransferase family 2, cytosolic sulfotransferase 2 [Alosa sapidissima]|uniref:sulfotransferase family 2, cytosolic sulfotransferase 2 n=1 Tax=Alosa sapidissima TaxID=34773 RepID=UPI001C08A6E4|nr:sulfotransferase family 2, cytosolic sulfotransferase 2 [Alosa sapidissima]